MANLRHVVGVGRQGMFGGPTIRVGLQHQDSGKVVKTIKGDVDEVINYLNRKVDKEARDALRDRDQKLRQNTLTGRDLDERRVFERDHRSRVRQGLPVAGPLDRGHSVVRTDRLPGRLDAFTSELRHLDTDLQREQDSIRAALRSTLRDGNLSRRDAHAIERVLGVSGYDRVGAARGRGTGFAHQMARGANVIGGSSRAALAGQALGGGLATTTGLGLPAIVGATGAAIVGTQALMRYADFENEMTKAAALVGEGGAEVQQQLEQQTREIAKKWAEPVQEVAWATYQALSGAVALEDSNRFMDAIGRFTKGEFLPDAAQAVDLLTTVINSYGFAASDAAIVTDKLSETIKYGKITAAQMSESMATVTPIAAAMGVSLDEVLAMLSAMTAQGVNASEATTYLRRAFVELGNESGKAGKNFRRFAGEDFDDFIKGGNSVLDAMQVMVDGAEEQGQSVANFFGRIQATQATQILTSVAGTKRYREAMAGLDDSFGVTARKAYLMMQTTENSFRKIGAVATDSLLTIGEFIASGLDPLFESSTRAAYVTDIMTEAFVRQTDAIAANTAAVKASERARSYLWGATPLDDADPQAPVRKALTQTLSDLQYGDKFGTLGIDPNQFIDALTSGNIDTRTMQRRFSTWLMEDVIGTDEIKSILSDLGISADNLSGRVYAGQQDEELPWEYESVLDKIFFQPADALNNAINGLVDELDRGVGVLGDMYNRWFGSGIGMGDRPTQESVKNFLETEMQSAPKWSLFAGDDFIDLDKLSADITKEVILPYMESLKEGFQQSQLFIEYSKDNMADALVLAAAVETDSMSATDANQQMRDTLNEQSEAARKTAANIIVLNKARNSEGEYADKQRIALERNVYANEDFGKALRSTSKWIEEAALITGETAKAFKTLYQVMSQSPEQGLQFGAFGHQPYAAAPEMFTYFMQTFSGLMAQVSTQMPEMIPDWFSEDQKQEFLDDYADVLRGWQDANNEIIRENERLAKAYQDTATTISGLVIDLPKPTGRSIFKNFAEWQGSIPWAEPQGWVVPEYEKPKSPKRGRAPVLEAGNLMTLFAQAGSYIAGQQGIASTFDQMMQEWYQTYVDARHEAKLDAEQIVIDEQTLGYLQSILSGEFAMGDWADADGGFYAGIEEQTKAAIDSFGVLNQDFNDMHPVLQEAIRVIERHYEALRKDAEAQEDLLGINTRIAALGSAVAGQDGLSGSFDKVLQDWYDDYVKRMERSGKQVDQKDINEFIIQHAENLLSGVFTMGNWSAADGGLYEGLEDPTLELIDSLGFLHESFNEQDEVTQRLIIAFERGAEAARHAAEELEKLEIEKSIELERLKRSLNARVDVTERPANTVQIALQEALMRLGSKATTDERKGAVRNIMRQVEEGKFDWAGWLTQDYRTVNEQLPIKQLTDLYKSHYELSRSTADNLGVANLSMGDILKRSEYDQLTLEMARERDRKLVADMIEDVQYEKGVMPGSEYLTILREREREIINKYGEWSNEALAIWRRIQNLLEELNEHFIDGLKINIGDATRDFERLMQTKDGNYEVTPEYIEQLQRAFNG